MNLDLDLVYRLIANRKLTNGEVDSNFRKLVAACTSLNSAIEQSGQDVSVPIGEAIQRHVDLPNPHPQYIIFPASDGKTYAIKDGGFIESGGIGRTNFTVQRAMDFLPDYYVAKENSAFVVEQLSLAPVGTPSQAVIPTLFINTLAGLNDTPSGGNAGDGHLIGIFNIAMVNSNCNDVFGQEFRLEVQLGKTLTHYVATKHVVGATDQFGGRVNAYVLEQLDDMRASVTNIGRFEQNYMDPRLITTHAGGTVRPPGDQITANIRLTNAHSGKRLLVNSSADVLVTVGEEVTEGFYCHLVQGGAGKIVMQPDWAFHSFASKNSKTTTLAALDMVEITCYRFGPVVAEFR